MTDKDQEFFYNNVTIPLTQRQQMKSLLERVSVIPIPDAELERATLYARELALGINLQLWGVNNIINNSNYKHYISRRWLDAKTKQRIPPPDGNLMETLGYFQSTIEGEFVLTRECLALLKVVEYGQAFISYRRIQSSAFALLILNRLKAVGIDAFLDMSIAGGDDWNKRIQSEIQLRSHFIILLSPQTLESNYVIQEIEYAVASNRTIVPIWHNGFNEKEFGSSSGNPALRKVLEDTHAIKVLQESTLEYNTRIVELLNVFGLTP